jgi:hypothetical protein
MPKQDDDGVDLPDAAFAPPVEPERPLELDPEWVAARSAKQAEARRPPPRASVAGVVIAVLLIAAVVAAIVWLVRR